jgi:hypothetical protein
MARYKTVIHSTMSKADAFAYMADMSNFDDWDPGIESSTQVVGSGPGLGAEYDVKLTAMTLRYKTTEYSAPDSLKLVARSTFINSFDTIEVTGTPSGCDVSYDAIVELNGPLRLTDPVFGLIFKRIGDRAAVGMAKALNGTTV